MYGWRGKIGLIVPSPNTVVEVEVNRLLPFGMYAYTSRCLYPEIESVSIEKKYKYYLNLNSKILKAAEELVTLKPDLIIWACTLGSILQNQNADLIISDKIKEKTGYSAITTATAVIEYIRYFNLKKIFLVTPYPEFFTNALKKYLLNKIDDLKIINTYSEEIIEGINKGKYFPEIIYQKIITIINNYKDFDSIFISCTNWPTLKIIKILEKDTGLKVFSSNLATVWYALIKMGRGNINIF